jgi:hypothetical protein
MKLLIVEAGGTYSYHWADENFMIGRKGLLRQIF